MSSQFNFMMTWCLVQPGKRMVSIVHVRGRRQCSSSLIRSRCVGNSLDMLLNLYLRAKDKNLTSMIPLRYSHSTKMLLKFSAILFVAAFLFASQTNAVADNDVDACNGSNHYDVGHDCAFGESQGRLQAFVVGGFEGASISFVAAAGKADEYHVIVLSSLFAII
ncbi:hypothetical protein BDZ89DRAFT_1113244 [Hymenopellis radicata]|nr:hypothetical protein BDZ89DRAFT_1113244 [Hymenopellis radicata]